MGQHCSCLCVQQVVRQAYSKSVSQPTAQPSPQREGDKSTVREQNVRKLHELETSVFCSTSNQKLKPKLMRDAEETFTASIEVGFVTK